MKANRNLIILWFIAGVCIIASAINKGEQIPIISFVCLWVCHLIGLALEGIEKGD